MNSYQTFLFEQNLFPKFLKLQGKEDTPSSPNSHKTNNNQSF